jgi:ArsR family transcriptional regulator
MGKEALLWDLSETLKAISAPIRRQILDSLKSGPKSAGEIVEQFQLTGATVSHHLSTLKKAGSLKKAGLILEEKQKNFIYYRLNYTVFEEVLVWIASFGGQQDEEN